jgi:hypothetical protein
MARRAKLAKALSQTDAAYLAGIIDGDGCFTAHLNRGYVAAALEVSSVCPHFISELRALTGVGNLCKKRKRTKNAKHLHVWHVHLGSLESLIVQVFPHLRLKKSQAALVLSLVRFSDTPSVWAADNPFQTGVLVQLNQLNQRGEAAIAA